MTAEDTLLIIAGKHRGRVAKLSRDKCDLVISSYTKAEPSFLIGTYIAEKSALELHRYRRFPITHDGIPGFVLVPSSFSNAEAVHACEVWFNEKAGPKP